MSILRSCHRLEIEADELACGMVCSLVGVVGCIVVHRYVHVSLVLVLNLGIVLKCKIEIETLKIAFPSSFQGPDSAAICGVDHVKGTHMSCRNEVIASDLALVYRVEVTIAKLARSVRGRPQIDSQIVPGALWNLSRSSNVRTSGIYIGAPRLDVIQRIPFEDQAVIVDIDFLEDAVHDPSYSSLDIQPTEIVRHLLVYREQSSFPSLNETELVLIQWRYVTNGLYCLDDLVILVQYDCVTTSVAKELVSLKQAQVLLS